MRYVWTVLFLFGTLSPVFAQSTGTINGRVADQSGAALPGVTILATNTATGVARESTTNSEGLYNLAALQPGTYNVRVELSGFAPQSRTGIVVLTGAAVTLDLSLAVAAVQE